MGAAGLVVAAGLSLVLGGAIGMLRFPDLYTRGHAANVANGVGAGVVVAGLAIAAPAPGLALRLLLLAALIWAAGPLLSHLIAGAAHAQGLAPYLTRQSGASREGGRQ
jgi:multicomponent Na+:H+ antiporter subunit G